MCRFKSGIILKNKIVIAPGENDSHSDLLESLGIEDDYLGASKKFVRAELVPKNDEWWVSPEEHPDKWVFIVDQDITPDWFDKEEHEKLFREAVCDWWKEHVLVDQKIDELSSGFYRLKRCEIKKLCNDVKVLLYGSQVGAMWENSQVREMRENSQVGEMRENSQVGAMRENSQVGAMWENSQVGAMWENSQVREMRENSQVGEMRGSSQVGAMWENSQVREMRGSSQVGAMWENSQVGAMWGSSTARDFKNYPNVRIWVSPEGRFKMVAHKND